MALARGDNSGNSKVNATETVLIDAASFTITLYTYNVDNNGTYVLEGDVELVSKTDKNILTNHEYGWCIQQIVNEESETEVEAAADTSFWDCMRVRTILNPFLDRVDPTWKSTFTILDGYTTTIDDFTTSISFLPDTDFQTVDDQTKNWLSVPDGSSKDCTYKAGRPPFIFVNCPLVNAHWVRNFTTDNPEQDIQLQLTREYANTTEWRVRGWHKVF